jgi:hypothetical protein
VSKKFRVLNLQYLLDCRHYYSGFCWIPLIPSLLKLSNEGNYKFENKQIIVRNDFNEWKNHLWEEFDVISSEYRAPVAKCTQSADQFVI